MQIRHASSVRRSLPALVLVSAALQSASGAAQAQDMLFDFQGNTPSVTPTFIALDCDGTVLTEEVRWEAGTENGTNNYRRLGLNAGTRVESGQQPRAILSIPIAHRNTRVRLRLPNDTTVFYQPSILVRGGPPATGFGWTPFKDIVLGTTDLAVVTFASGARSFGQLGGSANSYFSFFEVVTAANSRFSALTPDGSVVQLTGSVPVPSNYQTGTGLSIVVDGQPWDSGFANDAFHVSVDDISIMSLSRGTDCDNSGTPDIFWRNRETGQTYQWLMNQTTVQAFRPVGTFAGNWRIVGAGNIDNQGASDLVMQDTVTGDVRAWLYNADGSLAARRWLGNPGSTWRASAVADMTYDAMSDIIFRSTDGSNAIWTISSSGTLQSVVGLPFVADEAWTIIGAADMDYDGQNDLLWSRHGEVVLWSFGRDISMPINISYLGFAPTDWTLLAAGDFDNDGLDNDLMWHNQTTGDIGMWGMNAATLASWSGITNIGTTTAWQGGN